MFELFTSTYVQFYKYCSYNFSTLPFSRVRIQKPVSNFAKVQIQCDQIKKIS
jgi:hypothetical protein